MVKNEFSVVENLIYMSKALLVHKKLPFLFIYNLHSCDPSINTAYYSLIRISDQ